LTTKSASVIREAKPNLKQLSTKEEKRKEKEEEELVHQQ
jgi:hypothetical protein